MSNFLAVATVTATLGQLLQEAVAVVPGAEVTSDRPETPSNGDASPRVNAYLYYVTPNPTWRNADLPTRSGDGALVDRPLAALDLYYLLSFYGDEGILEPQRLLGSVVSTLHARPVITRQAIGLVKEAADDVDASDPRFYLETSDLDAQVEVVRFTPLPLDLDELSKLWSVFFQTPHALSVAYQASVVLIEPDEAPTRALPVRARNVYAIPSTQPAIERVVAAAGPNEPAVAGSTLVLLGRGLAGDLTLVRFSDVEVSPSFQSDTRLTVALPPGLRAGVRGVQVVRELAIGTPPVPHAGVDSNVAPFVLRPEVRPDDGGFEVTTANAQTAPDGTVSADVTVGLRPTVARAQRVVLLLTELGAETLTGYSFAGPERAADSDDVTIPVAGVRPGTYLVRVQVDGAESPLHAGPDGAYDGPTVSLP